VRLAGVACVLVAAPFAVGLAFAGSPDRIAAGVEIAGVDVGGLTRQQALALLQHRAARLRSVPVTFTAGSARFAIRPEQLGVEAAWANAVHDAFDRGGGFAIFRGYRRLGLRLHGATIDPRIRAYDAAVD
jgi:hypothetical protein